MNKVRLFITDTIHNEKLLFLNEQQSHYLKHVMRLSRGARVNIFNGKDGEWDAVVTQVNKDNVVLKAEISTKSQVQASELSLCFALVKWNAMRNIIRQSTELGVTKIQPILTDHTTVRRVSLEKLNLCAIEAAEQCERITIPEISDIITFYEACEQYKNDLVICDESGKGDHPREVLSKMNSATIMIGPEGGFSLNELKYKGAHRITLGEEILRVDTAVVAALTYLKAFLLPNNALR